MLAFEEKMSTVLIQPVTKSTSSVQFHPSSFQFYSQGQAIMCKPPKMMFDFPWTFQAPQFLPKALFVAVSRS
jgi:hypothetical protein